MKTTRMIAVAVLIVGGGLALNVAQAQQPGVTRTDLLPHDLGVSGREVVQVRVDFSPGGAFFGSSNSRLLARRARSTSASGSRPPCRARHADFISSCTTSRQRAPSSSIAVST